MKEWVKYLPISNIASNYKKFNNKWCVKTENYAIMKKNMPYFSMINGCDHKCMKWLGFALIKNKKFVHNLLYKPFLLTESSY